MEETKYKKYQELLKSDDTEKQYQFAKELQKDGNIEHAKILLLKASLNGHKKAKQAYYFLENYLTEEDYDLFNEHVSTFGEPYDRYAFIIITVSVIVLYLASFFL